MKICAETHWINLTRVSCDLTPMDHPPPAKRARSESIVLSSHWFPFYTTQAHPDHRRPFVHVEYGVGQDQECVKQQIISRFDYMLFGYLDGDEGLPRTFEAFQDQVYSNSYMSNDVFDYRIWSPITHQWERPWSMDELYETQAELLNIQHNARMKKEDEEDDE
jgi:hypothetical protein